MAYLKQSSFVLLAVALLLNSGCLPGSSAEPQGPGLSVNKSGVLIKDGKPYAGVGVTYFDAFQRTLIDPEDKSYIEGFQVLAEYGIPFARFNAGGFWPYEWDLYLNDKEQYFGQMDEFVAAAEQYGIGLIPSLFWYHVTITDLAKEPRSKLLDRESASNNLIRTYTRDVVERYKDSPAIWGWEFGNESNLDADLPNASEWRPVVAPHWGTLTERSELDDLTHEAIRTAFAVFAEEVRAIDPHRAIMSGNSLPRASAWNQMANLTWGQDTEGQFAEMLMGDNPDPMNMLSAHIYNSTERRFSRTINIDNVQELFAAAMKVSVEAKKPLYVGEFTASEDVGPELAREHFEKLLAAIENTKVPLSSIWVFDYAPHESSTSVTATNERAYQLELLQAANERMMKQGTGAGTGK